jgi:type I restriction enzyme S subunit
VLSSLDDKIDLLSRQNKTLEALAQTYFRQWFMEENNNDAILVEKMAQLDNNSINPSTQPDEMFYHYSIPAYDNGKNPTYEPGSAILSNKFSVVKNTVLVSKLNPRIPRIWLIGDEVQKNALCSTEFQVLKPLDMKYYYYLYFLMKSDDVTATFAMSATGTSGSHQRIRPEYILQIETPEPDAATLARFNTMATPLMSKVFTNSRQTRTLQALRDALLPRLISGEVRVKQ